MSLYDAIRHLLADDPHVDPQIAAKTILAGIRTRADMAEQVEPVVANAILFEQRGMTRTRERHAFTPRPIPDGAEEFDPLAARYDLIRLLEEPIRFGDGTVVTWGAADKADHLRRIDYMEKKVAGMNGTIAHHRQALVLIDEHGAHCLNDVFGESR